MYGRMSRAELVGRYVILTAFLLFFMFPFYWMVVTSLKFEVDAFAMPPKWLFEINLENYRTVLTETAFLEQTKNSLMVCPRRLAGISVFGEESAKVHQLNAAVTTWRGVGFQTPPADPVGDRFLAR